MTTLKKNTFGERYISLPDLKLSESNVKDENDKQTLQDWKVLINKSLIEINPDNPSAIFKVRIHRYIIGLIETRLSYLKKIERSQQTTNRENQNELIIKELKQHVPQDVFDSIIKKIKNRK